MNVTWLTYGISPYKMNLAQELSKYVNLRMFLYDEKDKHRDKSFYKLDEYNFELTILSNNWRKELSNGLDNADVLIDSMYSTVYGIYAARLAKSRKITSILQADGGIAKNRGLIINKAMSYMMNLHDYFLSSSEYVDKYFNYYGKKPILRYRFSSLTRQDILENKQLSLNKKEIRKQLGFSDRFSIISVGQIIPRKGYDIMLEVLATDRLCDKIDTYIVGGQPTGQLQELINSKNITNVHFVGSMSYEEVKKYYAASDCFLLCTREDIWGLVINEALSFGLPTITSNNCVAGLHFKDVVELCDVNDVKGYHDKVTKFINDPNYYQIIKEKSLKEIESYTIEESALDIYENLKKVLNDSSSKN